MADEPVWLEFTIRMAPPIVERIKKHMDENESLEDVISEFACLGLLRHEAIVSSGAR